MSEIRLFIASSLDGYIAREDGNLDWLDELENSNQEDFGYMDFYKDIDIVVMGRSTYDEVMGFGVEWPYSDCKTYVVSSKVDVKIDSPKTKILNEISPESIQRLKDESEKNVWLVGGGKLITAFLNLSAIDEMLISLIPRIIGGGISLFPGKTKDTQFKLLKSESFNNGAVNLTYRRR